MYIWMYVYVFGYIHNIYMIYIICICKKSESERETDYYLAPHSEFYKLATISCIVNLGVKTVQGPSSAHWCVVILCNSMSDQFYLCNVGKREFPGHILCISVFFCKMVYFHMYLLCIRVCCSMDNSNSNGSGFTKLAHLVTAWSDILMQKC